MLIWVLSRMASELVLLDHCDQCWLQFEIIGLNCRLSDLEYSSWIIGLQKSSIVFVIGGLLAASLCSSFCSCLSSAMVEFSAFFIFLKLRSVFSNSVSAGIRSIFYFLCINLSFLKTKHTNINRISLVNKYFQIGLLKVSG